MTLLFLSLMGCPQPEAECDAETECPLGSLCVDGECVSQSCATSDQCGIEQYCKDHSCVDGCEAADDCMFGDVCDAETNTCVAGECADTRTDCGFGEFCAPNGTCFDAGGYYCKPCEDDGDCGGSGNMCLSGYCGVTCSSDAECPGGYDCLPVSDWSGNVVANQCWTYCWLYEDEG